MLQNNVSPTTPKLNINSFFPIRGGATSDQATDAPTSNHSLSMSKHLLIFF
jgi:hypothetical protein